MHRTENCHRNHNERGKLGHQGNTGCARITHGLLRNQGGGDDGQVVFAKKRPRAKHGSNRWPGSVGRNCRHPSVASRGSARSEGPAGRGQHLQGHALLRPRGATHRFARLFPGLVSWQNHRPHLSLSSRGNQVEALITVPETQAWPPPPSKACLQIKAPPPQVPRPAPRAASRPLIWQPPGILA